MNPYEAPQSSLDPEPEKKRRVAVKYETYDTLEVVKMVITILLLLTEVLIATLILHRIFIGLGFGPANMVEALDQFMPWMLMTFFGIGGILWWQMKSTTKNS